MFIIIVVILFAHKKFHSITDEHLQQLLQLPVKNTKHANYTVDNERKTKY